VKQVATLPPSVRVQLIALGQLVKRAKLALERNEFVGDLHELFPDFNTAGLKLWEALKGVPMNKPGDMSWTDETPFTQTGVSPGAIDELNRIAATTCANVAELSSWCREAIDCLKEQVRLGGGNWAALSTPAQRLARAALKHATQLDADVETLGYLGGQAPADRSVMSAATGLAILRRLLEWCERQTEEGTASAGRPISRGKSMSDDTSLPPELRRKIGEIRQAAGELLSVAHAWELWTWTAGRQIEGLPDYGDEVLTPAEAISGMGKAIELKKRVGVALRTLYGHGCLPPPLRGRTLEDALALFPSYPEGAITSARDRQFVSSVRQALPALRELDAQLADWLDQLASAPLSVINAIVNQPPEGESERDGKEPICPPPSDEWIFAPSGNGYFVAGFGESGHLSGYKGLSDIARLIETPGKAVSMLDLEVADLQLRSDRRSRQPSLDMMELQEVEERLRELRADLDRAQKENNSVMADSTRAQIEQLESSLSSAKGLGRKVRDLNNHHDKLRPKIHGRLRTVYEAMQKADPPMNRLAEHFELSISCEGGSGFVYRPAGNRPPWRFQRTSEK
jgi:hypothetical protein